MSLFVSKIDPYSSFTINLGPLYVERVFDSLLTRQGVKDISLMNNIQRFEHYLGYLRCKGNAAGGIRFAMIQFYRGHFYLQLANHSVSQEFIQHYREKSLCYYQTYLELGPQQDEGWFYAQWQAGILQEVLHYPWAGAEEVLLRASNFDPLRAEANKRIIEHYIRCREWKIAYRFSSIAMQRFLNKNPVAHRRWFIDFDAYNWKVVRTHRFISYRLGLLKEKNAVNGTADTQAIPQRGQL